jgi:predicted Zn-ribbon and HTH transcriptional regulator
LPRVPITVMGFRCERCQHEWVPRDTERDPSVCPKCKSAYWGRPRKKPAAMMTYEQFAEKIQETLKQSREPLTWTEIRTIAKLPEKFPNNQWVRRMEKDISLKRGKDAHGIIKWKVS